MRKINQIFILLFVTLMLCSCSNTPSITIETDASSSVVDYPRETHIPPRSSEYDSYESTEETIIEYIDFEVNPVRDDMLFDDLMDYWIDILQIEDPRISERDYDYNWDFFIIYYPSYIEWLETELRYDEECDINFRTPYEYQYHIVRAFDLCGIDLVVYEFEDEYWAEEGLRTDINNAISNRHISDVYNHVDEGFFATRESDLYSIEYLAGNCIIIVYFPNSIENIVALDYYSDFCDTYDLPVIEEMISEIQFSLR